MNSPASSSSSPDWPLTQAQDGQGAWRDNVFRSSGCGRSVISRRWIGAPHDSVSRGPAALIGAIILILRLRRRCWRRALSVRGSYRECPFAAQRLNCCIATISGP